MRVVQALLALSFFAAPVAAQNGTPAPAPGAPPNPYGELFTRWDGVNRDSIEAEASPEPAQAAADAQSFAVPAYSPLQPRSQAEAVALGERVGQVVRAGDCAEGERIAREAGDFALVRAVRDHCRPR